MLLTHLLKMVSKRSREDSGGLWLRLPDSRVSVCLYPVLALQLTVQVWNLELSRLSKLGGWVGGRGAGLNRDVFFFLHLQDVVIALAHFLRFSGA